MLQVTRPRKGQKQLPCLSRRGSCPGSQPPRTFHPSLERLEDRVLLNAGNLDPTFGAGGQVITPVPSSMGVTGLLLQPDGKLVAGGSSSGNLVLERYSTDGTPDAAFGSGGQVSENLNLSGPVSLALQSNGDVVMASPLPPTFIRFPVPELGTGSVLARFLPNGAPDTAFGSSGVVDFPLQVGALAIQADGKIVVAGMTHANNLTGSSLEVARFNSDGSVDSSFGRMPAGTPSSSPHSSGPSLGPSPQAAGIGIQADGRIVVSATGNGASQLVGYDTNGTLDPSFGKGGDTDSVAVAAHGMAVLPDGRILVAGSAPGSQWHERFRALAFPRQRHP